jgi:hypothetical protein
MCRATKAKVSCTLTSQSASSSTISAVVMCSLSIRDHRLACARQQPSCAGLNELLDSGRALGCISLPFTCYLYSQICTRQLEQRVGRWPTPGSRVSLTFVEWAIKFIASCRSVRLLMSASPSQFRPRQSPEQGELTKTCLCKTPSQNPASNYTRRPRGLCEAGPGPFVGVEGKLHERR